MISKLAFVNLLITRLIFWISNGKKTSLTIDIILDADRQFIQVKDNAGGVSEEQTELLISPGASREDNTHAIIGIFGVGGKRAGIALGRVRGNSNSS